MSPAELKNHMAMNDLDDFKYLSEEDRAKMTPAELRSFDDMNSFEHLEYNERMNYKIEMVHLEKVLSS